MATQTIPPPLPVVAVSGEQIAVQLRTIPGTPTEVIWHISRNGAREEKFSLQEMTNILQVSQTLLAQARARRLGDTAALPHTAGKPTTPLDQPGPVPILGHH